jgi:hypothetical protein
VGDSKSVNLKGDVFMPSIVLGDIAVVDTAMVVPYHHRDG